ncbi:MAG: SIMPL domain-containing protein [Pseudomonadales bacterium]|jgi:hypothetical protein
MKRIAQWTSSILVILLVAMPLQAHTKESTEPRYIEVSGQGIIHETPDIALLTVTFSERQKKAAQAKETVDSQVENFLSFTRQLNIEARDIQAARINIHPEYDYKNNRQLIGYRVSRDVKIRIRDLLSYPKLLENAVEIGATNTGQLQLDFSNRKILEGQALQAAFKDARAQAQLLADVSGDKLGKALWVQASAMHSPVPVRMAMMAEAKGDASYPTGEISLSRQVQVRFALND